MRDIHNSVVLIHSLYYDSDPMSVKSNNIRIYSDNQAIEPFEIYIMHTNISLSNINKTNNDLY